VPAHLNTTVGAEVHVTGQTTKEGNATGEVEVVIRNNGGVGALILASELTLCYWSLPHSFLSQDDLYKSKACVTEQLFDDLSEIDSRSTWKIRHAFQRSAVKGSRVRVVQGIVFLWYARMDRLRVDTEPFVDIPRASQLTSITVDSRACRDWTLSVHRVEEESRFQGIVQRDRRLVYLRDPDAPGDAYFALTTKGEPLCDYDDEGKPDLPRWSSYNVAQRVGLATLRLNHEEWLDVPSGK
jgi:hypothetical protein